MGERLAKKLWRLKELERHLLDAHPSGLHNAELARRIEISRSEIPEYLDDLAALGAQVYDTDDGKHAIDPATHRVNLRLNLDESMAVLLAIRLLTTRSDKRNPHAAGALRELASAFDKLTPFIAQHIRQSANVVDGEYRRDDPLFLRWLERLTQAWAKQMKVRLDYESDEGKFSTHTFAPYFIEPYAMGNTLHVIGKPDSFDKLLTLKVERIRNVELLPTSYEIPPDFDPTDILRDAWGIWRTEKEPELVKLRFDRRVAYRVRETQWHYLEKVDEDGQGNLIWQAKISQPREMLPWIRGWGADCEVLEPEWLKRNLRKEAEHLAQLYHVCDAHKPPAWFYLWAKADRKQLDQVHRLIYHLIDVGQCALALWNTALPSRLKEQLAKWLDLSVDDAGRLLAFWAALHDLGKASPAFQFKVVPMISLLREQGFQLPDHFDKPTRHEVITAWALQSEQLLAAETGLDAHWAQCVAQALSGHHGAWHPYNKIIGVPESECGVNEWTVARHALVRELKEVFTPPTCNPQLKAVEQNALLTIFSGFVSVVDWLGSDEDLFHYEDSFMPMADYARDSKKQARDALQVKGWLLSLNAPGEFDFAKLFKVDMPSPAQQEVIRLASGMTMPALVIVESPTGSGKTEAALSLYALWTQSVERPGLYVAMPTTATSDQMHERVTDFLERWHNQKVASLLVHSRALLRDEEAKSDDADKVEEDPALRQTWFLPRKRSLLAPFGVGTVDQTFLSVLQTKHFFVRLLGLSHKVIIFDEVHAYDAYMAEIFCRLLRWLREIGASVILLSATLPEASRRRFVEAYTGREDDSSPVKYPRLSIAGTQATQIYPLSKPEERPPLALERVSRDIGIIVDRVRAELEKDGCVAVICNTVRRAQHVFSALEATNIAEPFCPTDRIILFHARTTQVWRDATQNIVLNALSKEARQKGERPPRMVVVATQVIEQSLDLDFDVMLTDLAPLDLLVQRAGRLHRHPPRNRVYPYRLLITTPEMKGDVPSFPRTDFPYEPNFLFRTWAVLQEENSLTLTADAPHLIEQVYGEEMLPGLTPALAEAMTKAQHEWVKDRAAAEREAGKSLVGEPGIATLLAKSNLDLEEDNPDVSRALQALTRRDAPGISLVCLHRVNGQICLDPQGNEPVNQDSPTPAQVRQLARRVITVQSYPLIKHFSTQEPPEPWKKIAALRYVRLAIFVNAEYTDSPDFTLRLTRALGLQIDYHKSGGHDDDL